ncbi:phosphate ABC transporter membrane protein 1 (PhoT family) [Jatrophihabitans sp. GAS493]|uniref:phosphate ABC transporter permease subunit PstC n=1 Tax=Jatrophihabitans sp. GAS493 TaxID=1907575 RepID=UPI000BB7FDDB|nr:phosphate ABC transporter permease subunit PstC [Jatrophihabitans sp. GAS493]SOD72288.1 phosphate ABC transporter membrane protein 1 (PhoT family) [Jatrophihabitans sp. GAS493]
MTLTVEEELEEPEDSRAGVDAAPLAQDDDVPRSIDPGLTRSDHIFRGTARGVGALVLVLTGSIGIFLGYQLIPTIRHYGFSFFTETQWLPARDKVGIAAVLVGSIQIAFIALLIAFPIALTTAVFISEYAPRWAKATLVALIDLMAAIPSVVFGFWGVKVLQPHAIYVSRWISQHFSWIPFFKVHTDPNAATWASGLFVGSAFTAGLIVGIMIIPLACAVMRGVFAQAPIGEREAAIALGSTRWGMIRAVVLPFGRGGIIGGTMLALGRALGETVAVLLIINPQNEIKLSVLTQGTNTISALIADLFGDATKVQLSALLAAGFVLFAMTLCVNTVAAIFVNRSRSGAGTDA